MVLWSDHLYSIRWQMTEKSPDSLSTLMLGFIESLFPMHHSKLRCCNCVEKGLILFMYFRSSKNIESYAGAASPFLELQKQICKYFLRCSKISNNFFCRKNHII